MHKTFSGGDSMYHVVSKPDCPWCVRAKELLEDRGLAFSEIVVSTTADVPDVLRNRFGIVSTATTVPQIVLRSKTLVGGYEALRDSLDEPLLRDNPGRWTAFPITYHDMWDMYRRGVASFWTAEEINLQQDAKEFPTLTEGEQHFIKYVLAFFAASDGIVNENLAARFAVEVQVPEARQFYAWQIFNESQHSHVYGLLIDTLVRDASERDHLFRAIDTVPAVRAKAAWALQWFDESRSFAERLVAFAAVEGVLFSGSFCAIYWLKHRGLMPGLGLSNEWISRDEGLHQQFAEMLYSKYITRKLTQERVEAIVRGAVEAETQFITDAVPVSLIGMNASLMTEYIKFVADRLLVALGHDKVYEAENPFPWMELISLSGKTNFFERFPSEYQRAGVMADEASMAFGLDEAF